MFPSCFHVLNFLATKAGILGRAHTWKKTLAQYVYFVYATTCETIVTPSIERPPVTEKAAPKMFEMPTEGTHLQSNLSFNGTMEITGEESFVINGAFEGLIIAKHGRVCVGKTGVFRGSIEAAHITVAGTVEPSKEDDSITATEVLAITSTGNLTSPTVGYGQIAMELGAVLHGQIRPSNPRPARSADPRPTAERAQPTTPSRVVSIDARTAAPVPAFLRGNAAVVAPEASGNTQDAADEPIAADHTPEPPEFGRTGTYDAADALTPIGD